MNIDAFCPSCRKVQKVREVKFTHGSQCSIILLSCFHTLTYQAIGRVSYNLMPSTKRQKTKEKVPTLWEVLERPRLRKRIGEILEGMRKHRRTYRLANIIVIPKDNPNLIFSQPFNVEMKFKTKARVIDFYITPYGIDNCSMSYERHDDD